MPTMKILRELRLKAGEPVSSTVDAADTQPDTAQVEAFMLRCSPAGQDDPPPSWTMPRERKAKNALEKTFPSDGAEMMTIAEAASMMRRCKRTVQQMAKEGKIPAVPCPKQYRIPRKQFMMWLEGSWSPSIAGREAHSSTAATITRKRAG